MNFPNSIAENSWQSERLRRRKNPFTYQQNKNTWRYNNTINKEKIDLNLKLQTGFQRPAQYRRHQFKITYSLCQLLTLSP
jgi:hypothetical protein